MEKLSQTLVSTLSLFQKRLEAVIDNDFETNHVENEKIQKEFEASRDVALIRGLSQGLPEDHIDRAVVVFSRLAMFFDGGVLLENNDSVWKAQAYFHKGVTQLFKSSAKSIVKIPHISLLTVLKTASAPVLEKMNLQHLDSENKTECLLVKATPDYAFFLFSSFPDLWLKEHTEEIRNALINGFAD
ncbi:hypothetical protein D3C87_161900 [compost metagenome]